MKFGPPFPRSKGNGKCYRDKIPLTPSTQTTQGCGPQHAIRNCTFLKICHPGLFNLPMFHLKLIEPSPKYTESLRLDKNLLRPCRNYPESVRTRASSWKQWRNLAEPFRSHKKLSISKAGHASFAWFMMKKKPAKPRETLQGTQFRMVCENDPQTQKRIIDTLLFIGPQRFPNVSPTFPRHSPDVP